MKQAGGSQSMHKLHTLLWVSAVIRLVLVCWGEVQDRLLDVKYTDIDYIVFSDAARFVAQGGSPFQRSTYRYSPLLAYLLLPNIWLHGAWGKLLFSAGDIFAAILIARLLARLGTPEPSILLASAAWLYNPYTLTISTRGSCDVLAVLLLLGMLQLILSGQIAWAAIAYGLVVHLRIYPIIFAPALVFFLATHSLAAKSLATTPATGSSSPSQPQDVAPSQQSSASPPPTSPTTSVTPETPPPPASLWSYPASAWLHQIVKQGLIFGCTSAAVFFLLGAVFYKLYGHEFLHEAFLHHVTRKDPRHNFSPHFYPTYLTTYHPKLWPAASGAQSRGPVDDAMAWANNGLSVNDMEDTLHACDASAQSLGDLGSCNSETADRSNEAAGSDAWQPNVGALASVAQLALQLVLAAALHWDLPGCLLLQTMAFVALNKVCTAQYFVWYFSLLPLVLPRIPWPPSRTLVLGLVSWVALQLHWLLWGYLLEFQGLPVHLLLWAASLAFLAANVFLMVQLLDSLYGKCRRSRRSFFDACLAHSK